MKKRMIALWVLVIVLIVIAVFLLTRPAKRSMEDIFPAKVLVYARLSHVASDLEQFSQSSFWRQLSTMDVPKVLERNGVSAEDIKQYQKMRQQVEFFVGSPLTKKFLGNELAMGVYDKNEILLATRLGFSLQMAELFVSMARQWSDEISTRTEEYNGFNIVHVHFTKRKLDLEYVRVHDVLLASVSPSGILHQVIDVYCKKRASLNAEADFSRTVTRFYPQGHGIFYINMRKVYGVIERHIPAAQKKNVQQILGDFSGLESYSISVLPQDILRMKIIMNFDSQGLGHYWHFLSSCPGEVNSSLKFTPYNVTFYNWGSCYDLKEMWQRMKEQTKLSESLKEGLEKWEHRLEKRLKLNIEKDVLPAFGAQIGGYLNDLDMQGAFPYPRGLMFIKIRDQVLAQGLMDKIIQNPIVSMQKEDYGNTSIHFMTLPLGANIDPGYAFLDGYLLLATSRQLLKTSIDALKDPNQAFSSNDSYRQFNFNDPHVTQGEAFVKIDEISSSLQQFLGWYNKVASSQITTALSYQQEVLDRKKELEESVSSKKEELVLAKKKLKELQAKLGASDITDVEKVNRQADIDSINEDIKQLQEDMNTFGQQREQLKQAYVTYQDQAQSAKMWLFNSDEVVMPFLKSFEGLHALGMKWNLKDQASEMEISIK